ncbi:MAG: protein-disulfide reductase DsbD [Gammaproteobacteria bacterium]|jgi:thiol:disulfide interchange protein DsbD
MKRLIFSALLACAVAGQAQEPEILRPEAAFPYEVSADAQRVTFAFAIPEGYYLYRDRFDFASATAGVSLAAPEFPQGEMHEDEFFGVQEIYRGHFDIALPLNRSGTAQALEIELGLQGCADFGLCYPPQDWTANVTLPPVAAGAALPVFDAAGGFLPGSSNAPLPPEQAFVMNARFDSANELTVGWQIEPGYYLYRDKFDFSVDGDIGLGAAELPEGVPHTDQNFGDVEVFYDYVEARIPFARAGANEMPITVSAGFQGCKEDSICYPPMQQSMALTLPATDEFTSGSRAALADAEEVFVSEQDALANLIRTGSILVVLGSFFALGLGLSFTPCVLPMIPIISSIVTASKNVTPVKGFSLSLAYVLGMAVTYTVAGALAALSGSQIQAMFQHPVVISVFAAIFVVLALGMFGMFELQMPAAIQTRISALANQQRGGTYAGVAAMGALSALIVTACVAPPLIATLSVIGQSGDVARGSSALFAMSLGMGVPLLIVGASGGTLLPKAGAWMNTIKAAFGVMMVGVAIYMLDRILPGGITLALWGALVFFSGVFLGAFDTLPENPAPARRLSKGIGVLVCLYGALMLIGAVIGGNNPLRPVPQSLFSGGGNLAAPVAELEFREIETVAALETVLAEARGAGRPVMIDFTADWCVSCREMEEYTFPDSTVIAALEPFVLLRADVTANNDDDKALLEYFRSYGPPTIAFFDSSGTEQDPFRLVGYVPAERFAQHVTRLAAL